MRAAPGVTPTVLPTGDLELSSEATGTSVRCGPVGTAMWLALVQCGGRIDGAARLLAGKWGVDQASTYEDVAAWAAGMCGAGMLEEFPGPDCHPLKSV